MVRWCTQSGSLRAQGCAIDGEGKAVAGVYISDEACGVLEDCTIQRCVHGMFCEHDGVGHQSNGNFNKVVEIADVSIAYCVLGGERWGECFKYQRCPCMYG